MKKTFFLFVKMIAFIPIVLVVILFFLVRFTDLTYSDHGKAIVGYNEESKKWIFNDWELRNLDGVDGPYVIKKGNGFDVIRVIKTDDDRFSITKVFVSDSIDSIDCYLDNKQSGGFKVKLQEKYTRPDSYYDMPDQLIAISDIEGNFEGFYSFLLSNGVIDSAMNWTFNNGHLVLLGDFMDRGKNVTQVLWLIYKLETDAEKFHGKVHFILGNHEVMNLEAQTSYINHKYISIAQQLTNIKNHKEAYSKFFNCTVLFQWLKSKNAAVQIGDYLFVHGGISPGVKDEIKTIEEMNNVVYKCINHESKNELIMGELGPLWYRGLIEDKKDSYKKPSYDFVTELLNQYDVKRIVVGHTLVDEISTDYNGKVVRIDVKHSTEPHSGQTRGILIRRNKIYKVNALDQMHQLD